MQANLIEPRREPWMADARCRGVDPNTSMARKGVDINGRWRYYCKHAWNALGDLQEAAREVVPVETPRPVRSTWPWTLDGFIPATALAGCHAFGRCPDHRRRIAC